MNGYALLILVFCFILVFIGIIAYWKIEEAYNKGLEEGYKQGSQPTKAELYNRRIFDKEREELRRKP